MGINIGVGSDPGSQEVINFEAAGAAAPTSPVKDTLTTDIMQLSTIAQSDSASSSAAPAAGSPTLSASLESSFFDHAIIDTAYLEQARVVNEILDNWTKQIQEEAQLSAESNKRSITLQNVLKDQRLESDVQAQNVKDQQIGATGTSNFHQLSPADKSSYIETNGDQMIGTYVDAHNDAVIQNSDLAKGGIPAFQAMKEVLVANPLSIDLAMRAPHTMDSQATLAEQLSSLVIPSALSEIPQINLFLPMLMYTSAAGAAFGLYGKQGAAGEEPNEAAIDEKFVTEFGKKTLINTENTESWLLYRQPGFEQLPQDQQQAVVLGANLLALTAVLIFDVKAQARASNLSPEEFQSMLANGNPDNPVINTVLGRINSMFVELEKSKPNEVDGYKNFVNSFITSAQLKRFNIDDLRDFSRVLLYANNTISEAERVVKRTA